MCREGSETGSSPKRIEKKVCCSPIGEISWRFGVKCSAIWRKPFGDLEKTYSAILGEDVLGDLEKSFGDFGENVFGDNVGYLQNHGRHSYDDFKLEFAME